MKPQEVQNKCKKYPTQIRWQWVKSAQNHLAFSTAALKWPKWKFKRHQLLPRLTYSHAVEAEWMCQCVWPCLHCATREAALLKLHQTKRSNLIVSPAVWEKWWRWLRRVLKEQPSRDWRSSTHRLINSRKVLQGCLQFFQSFQQKFNNVIPVLFIFSFNQNYF